MARPLISAVIPSQNRPSLLEVAVQNRISQTLPQVEVIVVDDGSIAAVDCEAPRAKFGPMVGVLRNEVARGLAYSMYSGVEAATGDYVTHLADDDLLAPETFAEAHAALSNDPGLDLVFLGVEGFGPRAEHFNYVQPEAVARAIALTGDREQRSGARAHGSPAYVTPKT